MKFHLNYGLQFPLDDDDDDDVVHFTVAAEGMAAGKYS